MYWKKEIMNGVIMSLLFNKDGIQKYNNMGGCITNPKNLHRSKTTPPTLIKQQLLPLPSQTVSINQLFEPTIIYPYYQSLCPQIQAVNYGQHVDLAEVLGKMGDFRGKEGLIAEGFPFRYYSYHDGCVKKLFQSSSDTATDVLGTKIVEFADKLIIKRPLLQSLVLGPTVTQKIQISPQYECLILQKNSIAPLTQQCTLANLNSSISTFYQIIQNQKCQYEINMLDGQEIKKLGKQHEKCKQIVLNKNCLMNGIIFRTEVEQNQAVVMKEVDNLLLIFNQKQQQLCIDDRLICYINPLISCKISKEQGNRQRSFYKKSCTTYLQLKSLVQQTKKDIAKLFKPSQILTSTNCEPVCIYLLIFCLKIVMFNFQEKSQIPFIFLQQFLKMQVSHNQILQKVINVMKFYFSIGTLHDENYFALKKEEIVANCCRNILQISSVNSHILIDAYLIQFGIEIDEKTTPSRQNPLYSPTQPIKYRINVFEKPDYSIINGIKQLSEKAENRIIDNFCRDHQKSSEEEKLNILHSIFKEWEQKATALHRLKFGQPKGGLKINQLQRSQSIDLNKLTYNTNQKIIMQLLLTIKIYKFVCLLQIQTGNFLTVPQDGLKIKNIKAGWQEIIQSFITNSAYSFCSAELALTMLVFDSLIKMMQDPNFEGIQQSLNKAVDIWCRVYRDPRAKYKPYLPNCWITFMIKILSEVKIKLEPNTYSSQNIFHLHNIVQCLYSNQDMVQYGYPSEIEWIFHNIPTRNISGIFFTRAELLTPMPDNYESALMKSGCSLLQNPNSDLSSKSNYSESVSNTNSSFSRTKRKYKNRIFSSSKFSDHISTRAGVYMWGKGINCSPLVYPFSKNLDILKIACGNYHVVIATTLGIFGWGQNGSGQLGDSIPKQNVKSITMVLQKLIKSSKDVDISCGNQHTAILLKDDALIMFGQTEGGITAGNGYKFDSISCGGLHTLGIRNGELYSWGRGEGGQLGHKAHQLKTKVKEECTDFYLDCPKKVEGIPFIKKSVCGDAHSVLLSEDGDVFVFGFSYQGQLGMGITGDSDIFQIFQPVKLEFKKKNTKIVDIFAGSTFSFFKTVEGEIYSCGLNDCNQLGIQKMMKIFQKKKYLGQQKKSQRKMGEVQFSRPNKIQIFNNQIKVDEIYCGQNHCLASVQYMKKNKMIMGWGLNKQYQISSEFLPQSQTPRTIDNLHDFNFSSICCGSIFSLGLILNENVISLKELQDRIQQIMKKSLTFTYRG